jgi:stage II sporulation protein D
MKKIIFFVLYVSFLILVIPGFAVFIFSPLHKDKVKSEVYQDKKIELYRCSKGEVIALDFEEYIKGVTYAEMPASFDIEALKAQAVAARTYTYRKLGQNIHEKGDMCDDFAHCQAWKQADDSKEWEKISRAVEETRGEIITYNKEPINAVFHSSSGGKTENSAQVWSGGPLPYLVAVDSPNEDKIMKNFETLKEIDKKEFESKLKEERKNFKYNVSKDKIKILGLTDGGRVEKIKIGNETFSGVEIRNIFELRSSNFTVEITKNKVIFRVKGYGHGVGLSQWGAEAMARNGAKYDEILKHYYNNTEIINNII